MSIEEVLARFDKNEYVPFVPTQVHKDIRSLVAEVRRLQAELANANRERVEHFADVRQIRERVLKGSLEPALAFTSGPEREVADFISELKSDLASANAKLARVLAIPCCDDMALDTTEENEIYACGFNEARRAVHKAIEG